MQISIQGHGGGDGEGGGESRPMQVNSCVQKKEGVVVDSCNMMELKFKRQHNVSDILWSTFYWPEDRL